MKSTHTLLIPNMLPYHFNLGVKLLKNYGYKAEVLNCTDSRVAQTGLKYVHNDICYPAILVVGQFIDAIENGKYDPHKVALMYFQTGGGCRASNYVSLLRKALEKAGYSYVPVIAVSLLGIEKHPGFKVTLPLLKRMMYCFFYGDLLMSLVNQCKPYEITPGSSEKLAQELTQELGNKVGDARSFCKNAEHNFARIISAFTALPCDLARKKVRVGVVGEIYVKYSALGNNNLENFLVDHNAEVIFPGLMGFMFYFVYNIMSDYTLYREGRLAYIPAKMAYAFLEKKEKTLNRLLNNSGRFRPSLPFKRITELIEPFMGKGCKMGEGWLLPAEMLELIESGVPNIICTQPFGCLPNHICGKGMLKPIKDKYPNANIIAVDYDASASSVNQENRIELMLANAQTESPKEHLD